MERKGRNFLYGTEIAALHASTEFKIRKPVIYGNLNVTSTYSALECCDDLQRILQAAVQEKMGLTADKFKFFNVVLVIPD